jgi:hypothetical protein
MDAAEMITPDTVIAAGACADGVYDWLAEQESPPTALTRAEATRLAEVDDKAGEYLRTALQLDGDGDGDGYGYGYGDGYGEHVTTVGRHEVMLLGSTIVVGCQRHSLEVWQQRVGRIAADHHVNEREARAALAFVGLRLAKAVT